MQSWRTLGELIFDAVEVAADRATKALKQSRKTPELTSRQGHETPLWNICAT
ncbi:hypothetical protein OH491_12240 [Termitidicoccus mucosus]|uniref:hypothetical protein n=1 Tax=Termitidicoccus mucosus TaxID=1184151 RepID=UPI002678909C